MWKDIGQVALTAVGSFIVLFLLAKLMGNREMSQLSMFDYINGITIGSIAAEMATSLESDFLKPLTAMIIYAGLSVLLALITNKFMKVRRFVEGTAMILYDNGKLYESNLKKAKMDLSEFLTLCRNSGYFNLANIQTAVMEANGKISFLPVSKQRPATPQDMNLNPPQEKLVINVVMDGKILMKNLQVTGNDTQWLSKQLDAQHVKLADVFLATCDSNNNLSVYCKIKQDSPPTVLD